MLFNNAGLHHTAVARSNLPAVATLSNDIAHAFGCLLSLF